MPYRSMADSDCVVVMGSNMAENHPVAFRWPMKARMGGATLIHVDPRFTRTSAMANIYAPIRAGSDIAFLGGVLNLVLMRQLWNTGPFFKEFVLTYTNAATIISGDFKDTEDLDGVFSGLMQYKGGAPEWPFNGFVGEYDSTSWQYARTNVESQGWKADTQRSGEHAGDQHARAGRAGAPRSGTTAGASARNAPEGPPYEGLVRSLLTPAPLRDETLANPRCALNIVKRHFSRYTPEMVEEVTGCPKETFLKVAQAILDNSGRDRTTSFAYAVAWT